MFAEHFCCRPLWLISAMAVALIVPPVTSAPPIDTQPESSVVHPTAPAHPVAKFSSAQPLES
jgi:hypothetical protein